MTDRYNTGEKILLGFWFLIVCIIVSGCGNDIECQSCGLRANQATIVQSPAGVQFIRYAGADGCIHWSAPSSSQCSDYMVSPIGGVGGLLE